MADLNKDTYLPMIPKDKPLIRVGILSEIVDYNHSLMNIPAIWRCTKGENVKIAILDTGLPSHMDLDPEGGKSFVPGYSDDKNGHSTFVSGIVSAVPNNGMGVAGICPNIKDYYGTVLDQYGSGSVTSIVKGIYWAVDEIGADVINMSLGIPGDYRPGKELEDACDYAVNQGCTVFAAAGNDAHEVNWPAAYDSVIAVAAVDKNMNLAKFSSRGPEVEFAAGGVNVFSTYKNNSYATMSGTSFSCPAVAAVGCLIAAKFKAKGIRLTPEEIRTRIKKIAYDVGPEGRDNNFGFGIPVFTKDCLLDEAGVPEKISWWKRLLDHLRIW